MDQPYRVFISVSGRGVDWSVQDVAQLHDWLDQELETTFNPLA